VSRCRIPDLLRKRRCPSGHEKLIAAIEIDVFQTSGGALNLNTATLSLVRLPGATANAF
jgi:hypothetical protein